jgi:thioesterase domain-containing protein
VPGSGTSGEAPPVTLRAELQAYLHAHIPLSVHLGAWVVEAGNERVRLQAPLAPNLNHRSTAFGGSISAMAILAGWSLLWVRLRGLTPGHHIVIAENSVAYLAPVTTDFTATCAAPADAAWERFLRTFRQRGRARIELEVAVEAAGATAASFRGRFVVLRREGGG